MQDGQCKSGYDKKAFLKETKYVESQIYPMYRRRSPADGGATYTTRTGRVIDNRSVVPHSPYLAKKYKCHLNVEVCFSVASVKYLYKYVCACRRIPTRAPSPSPRLSPQSFDALIH